MTLEKKNLIPESSMSGLDWNWFQSLVKSSMPHLEKSDLYVTLSNYLDGELFLHSRSDLMDNLSSLNQDDFCASYPCSFRLTNVQLLSAPVSKICHQLEQYFNRPVACNLYFTPAKEKNCFDYHADHQDTYIIQLLGSKEWSFPLNESDEPIRFVKAMNFKDSGTKFTKEKKIIITQGDQLSVPYAFVHDVNITGDGPSLHLTFATYDKQYRLVTESFVGTLLKSIEMDEKQFEKLETEDIRKIIGVLKRAAFSLSADELDLKIQNEVFLDNIRVSKRGRPYPATGSTSTDM